MPKKVIANLNIQIGASSATLRKDFKAGGAAVKGFARDVQGTAGRLRSFDAARSRAGAGLASFAGRAKAVALGLTGIVTSAAAAAVSIGGVINQLGQIDKVSKTADKLGETTEGLSRFNHAASQTGVDAAAANIALQRMTRRLSAAAAGTGATGKALEELGVDAQALAKMAPTRAFGELAEAFKNVENSSDRVRLAFALFDSGGVNLVNTLALGKSGLAELAAEADRLGITFTREMGAKVEAANDAVARMGASLRGLTQQLAISLAPAIVNISDALTNLAVYVGHVDMATVKSVVQFGAMAVAFSATVVIIPKVVAGIRSVIVALRAMATAGAITQALSGPAGWASLVVGLATAGAAAYGVNQAFDRLGKQSTAAAGGVARLGDQLEVALPEDLADPVDEAAEKMQRLAAENERWISIGQRITDSVATPLEKLKEDLAETHEALRRGKVTWETYQRAVQKLGDDFAAAEGGASRLAAALPTGGVSAAVKGTRSGSEAVRQSIAAGRKMTDHLKKLRDAAKTRERQLSGIIAATYEVEEAVREDRTRIIRHRIPGA